MLFNAIYVYYSMQDSLLSVNIRIAISLCKQSHIFQQELRLLVAAVHSWYSRTEYFSFQLYL